MEINGPSGPVRIVLAVLVGLGTMGYGAYSYTAQSSALASAVEVEATISTTSVETIDQRRGVAYEPQATFEFTFEGDRYTGSNVYPGPLSKDFGTREAARAALDGVEAGDTVTAYVPPENPGTAYLERSRTNEPLFLVGFGALFLLGTAYSVLKRILCH